MSHIIRQYTDLSISSSRDQVSQAFRAILVALPARQLNADTRKSLTRLILDDLRTSLLDNTISRLSKDDATLALRTIKSLGGTPEIASFLATASNLRCLLNLSTKIDSSQQNDALRCIANTLLLNESARVTFVGVEVDGGNASIDLLQNSSSVEHIFLVSRILFFCTAMASSAAPFIESLVEHKRPNVPGSGTAVDIFAAKVDDLVDLIRGGNRAAREALVDLLKLIFNLFVHYPKLVDCEVQSPEVTSSDADNKVMGDYWSSRLDRVGSLVPPLIRAFHFIPPSSNPLEMPLPHIIHSLITVPVGPATRNLWFGSPSSALSPVHSPANSASSSSSGSPRCDTPLSGFKETKSRLLERATSVLSTGRRSLSCSSGSRSSTPTLPDSALRAYELLDATLAHFMPGDVHPDDPSVRSGVPEGETLDDLVSPLVMLITRFCLGDEDAKVRIRNWFIPANLDRTSPLEQRSDLLGRCLRLLQSLYHNRLHRVCGEMFFAMCDSDATTLGWYLGYGNVAGFLFHKGIATPSRLSNSGASGAPATTSTGLPINPITGTVQEAQEPIEMTDEEREQEAEKLYTLFDRLERTGAMPPNQNPIRMAMQRGPPG